MSEFYRSIRTKKLIALLVRHGFISKLGSKHGKYVRESDNKTVIVPRHRVLSSGTSKQICEYLNTKCDIAAEELARLF
ncbi:addiction module toxin, HicA family [Candidatus Saccharibacteria bacterium oral taxon 488]|nr:addiction module toxin, HicA family [Candidatus Saccharibacteria bacterium oral taxon 488]